MCNAALLCHVVARSFDGQQDALSATCSEGQEWHTWCQRLSTNDTFVCSAMQSRAALMASKMLSVPPAMGNSTQQ
jgi:hypothetical protein